MVGAVLSGPGSTTTGGLLTLTLIAVEVVVSEEVSLARAVRLWEPLAIVVVFQL